LAEPEKFSQSRSTKLNIQPAKPAARTTMKTLGFGIDIPAFYIVCRIFQLMSWSAVFFPSILRIFVSHDVILFN
jgi:hypothetical protein